MRGHMLRMVHLGLGVLPIDHDAGSAEGVVADWSCGRRYGRGAVGVLAAAPGSFDEPVQGTSNNSVLLRGASIIAKYLKQ